MLIVLQHIVLPVFCLDVCINATSIVGPVASICRQMHLLLGHTYKLHSMCRYYRH